MPRLTKWEKGKCDDLKLEMGTEGFGFTLYTYQRTRLARKEKRVGRACVNAVAFDADLTFYLFFPCAIYFIFYFKNNDATRYSE